MTAYQTSLMKAASLALQALLPALSFQLLIVHLSASVHQFRLAFRLSSELAFLTLQLAQHLAFLLAMQALFDCIVVLSWSFHFANLKADFEGAKAQQFSFPGLLSRLPGVVKVCLLSLLVHFSVPCSLS